MLLSGSNDRWCACSHAYCLLYAAEVTDNWEGGKQKVKLGDVVESIEAEPTPEVSEVRMRMRVWRESVAGKCGILVCILVPTPVCEWAY